MGRTVKNIDGEDEKEQGRIKITMEKMKKRKDDQNHQ
jgi:hypothetical protein